MRRSLPVIVAAAAAAALVLAGCSSSSTQSQPDPTGSAASSSGACTPTASGSLSDAVKLTAKPGSDPKATFDTPLAAQATQRTVATKGSGDLAAAGSTVKIDFALYDGTSGKEITTTGWDGSASQSIALDDTVLAGLTKTLECSTIGSRVVGVLSPADMWGSTGQESLGVAADTTIVFVADLESAVVPASVEKYDDMTGMPTVKFASSGEPTITIPKADPPSKTRIGLITEGTGATVTAGATVSVQYTGVVWRTGKVFDSSWSRGQAASFVTNQVVKGFEWALEGQKVGSTLMSVIAPDDGYGSAGQSSAGIKGTDTMVFVITIEGVQ